MDLIDKKNLKMTLHQDWNFTHNNTRLKRDFIFKNFKAALEFCYDYGLRADKTRHHPDILVKWQHCEIEIWTHDLNDLNIIDFELAKLADETYANISPN